MLTNEIIQKIEEAVYQKPRSIDEIAKLLKKNWRTADRYIKEIEENYGTITTTVFRAGSRGALKVVYWTSVEKASKSIFQQELEQHILAGRNKDDISPFDIYQHIAADKKTANVEEAKTEQDTKSDIVNLREFISQTKKQLIMFSGNLSYVNIRDEFEQIEALVKKGISIKVICRVDFEGRKNVEKLLSLNHKYGKELIEVHHRDQPLRALISDGKAIRFKEIKEPTGKANELNKYTFIFYQINDKNWAEWLSKVFWKMFSASIDASKRIEELRRLT